MRENTSLPVDSGILTTVDNAGLHGPLPLIFYYHRLNRYSFNALAGALDGNPELADAPVWLARTAEELRAAAAAILPRHGRAVLALSVLTSQRGEIRALLCDLRSKYGARLTVMAGGPHATADVEDMLDAGADMVFCGEAEVSFPTALKRLAAGQGIGDVEGVAFRSGGELRVRRAAHPVDIDAFASFSPRRGMLGPIEITRGCPFACSFCQTSHLFGTRPRHRSVANVTRQAAALRSRRNRIVRVLSPNAFSYGSPDGRQLNLTAIHELLAALRDTVTNSGRIIFGHFPSEVRPEHVMPETLELLRRFADNDEIVIGAQSGSPRVLEACHRSHTVEDVVRAVSLARKSGYKVIVDIMLGLPGDGAKEAHETAAVIRQLTRLGARIHPHAFVPLPQTGFSGEVPGAISDEVLGVLEELRPQRGIYGDWTSQRRLAAGIWRRGRAAS